MLMKSVQKKERVVDLEVVRFVEEAPAWRDETVNIRKSERGGGARTRCSRGGTSPGKVAIARGQAEREAELVEVEEAIYDGQVRDKKAQLNVS